MTQRYASRVDPVELEQPNVDWRKGGAPWKAASQSQVLRPVQVLSASRRRRSRVPAPAPKARLAQSR
jgi:hypothetical protein